MRPPARKFCSWQKVLKVSYNKVVGVVSLAENCEIDEAELISSTREHLSGYKLPKSITFVSEVMRAPNGKADYKWAKKVAEAELI